MASSSFNEYVTVEVGEEYPYPSHVCAASCISVKLSGRDKYVMWKTQMLCLIESHGMSGFIDGTFVRPPQTSISVSGKEKVGEGDHRHRLWRRSDAVVKSWILCSLTEQTLGYALNRLTEKLVQQTSGDTDFSAKDIWDELQTIYAPAFDLPPEPLVVTDTCTMQEMRTLYSGTIGDELLVTAISSKQFALAEYLLKIGKKEKLHSDAVLMAIAQNHPRELSMLEEYYTKTNIICSRVEDVFRRATDYIGERFVPLCGPWVKTIIALFLSGIYMILWLFPLLVKMLVGPFLKETIRIHADAMHLSRVVCDLIMHSKNSHHCYANPILEATTQNAYEVVECIVNFFPNSIWSTNADGHNIIQLAVVSRSEKVYNLVCQMREHKNIYRTIKDSSGNNLLHLAARLAPTNKLNLISGAALQVQRELQWFEEVRRIVCPLNAIQKNSSSETPQMIFSREHKDLVVDGEKWMKATAESYTITAALITTIVFAAAITVPGGNKDTGIPVFTNDIAFTIFAISDAISLFTSVTSLLMFLSILTARFADRDFLYKLPTKLIIGLTTLFISTTAMIVAFGATLFLVFGQSNSRMIIPIAALTCLPITSFVTLQLPLVIDLMSATYGRSIFGKKRDTRFY